jgi:hypothetical protein
MQKNCYKKCPYKKIFGASRQPHDFNKPTWYCDRGKCSTACLDRYDFPDNMIFLENDNKGIPLRHKYCLEYFGEGMNNKEKIIKWIKRSPYILKNRIRSLRWKIQYRYFPKKQTDEEFELAFDDSLVKEKRRKGYIS